MSFSNKFESLPERGHPREVLREISRLGTSLEFEDFFCIHRSTNRNGAFPRISFTRLFLWTFRNILYYFLLCHVSISTVLNAKINSTFEREDKSNGNPLLHHGIFSFSFTRIFRWTFRTIPYYFFKCRVRIFRRMNAKKISTFEREHSSNGNPRLHNVFGSPVKKANTKVKKATR